MTAIPSKASADSRPLRPALSPPVVLTILVLTVGWGGIRSATRLFRESAGQLSGFDITVMNDSLVSLLAFELIAGISLAAYLRRRGWTLEQLTLPPGVKDLLRGLGLWLAPLFVAWLIFVAIGFGSLLLGGSAQSLPVRPIRFVGQIDWVLVAGVSLINPIFEEFLWLAFVARAFPGAGAWRIGTLSVALRVLVHTYQGVFVVLFIAPLGVIYAVYYLRTRRIWPVILAHAIQDAIGLSWLAATGGLR